MRSVRLSAVMLALGSLGVACASSQKAPVEDANTDAAPPPACHKDETREYYCDDLLPIGGAKPAADPYATCPGSVPVKGSVFPATSSIARFDVPRTEWTRKRVPPGHSCCYSWCSKVAVAPAAEVDPASCSQPNAMREKLCINELDAGTTESSTAPYDHCPSAITPPPGVAFSAPKAAGLDPNETSARRGQGLSECCYGWCSRAPLGTGLGPK